MSTIGAQASLVNDLRTTHSPRTLTEITNTHISERTHITKVVFTSLRFCYMRSIKWHLTSGTDWLFFPLKCCSDVPINGPKHERRYNEAEPGNVHFSTLNIKNVYSTENLSKLKISNFRGSSWVLTMFMLCFCLHFLPTGQKGIYCAFPTTCLPSAVNNGRVQAK